MSKLTKNNQRRSIYKNICKDAMKSTTIYGSILLNVEIYRGQKEYILRK